MNYYTIYEVYDRMILKTVGSSSLLNEVAGLIHLVSAAPATMLLPLQGAMQTALIPRV